MEPPESFAELLLGPNVIVPDEAPVPVTVGRWLPVPKLPIQVAAPCRVQQYPGRKAVKPHVASNSHCNRVASALIDGHKPIVQACNWQPAANCDVCVGGQLVTYAL